MAQRDGYQLTPVLIILWRCYISLPVKDRLLSGSHFIRHKAQFQKRPQAAFPVAVHNKVQISEIIFRPFYAGCVFVFLIDSHIIGEKAMPADMAESDFLLYKLQLLHIFLL